MRIALINPPSQGIKNSVKDLLYGCWCQGKRIGGSTFPPLNLLTIGTVLEEENIVKIIDYQGLKLNYSDLIKYLANFNAIIIPTTSFCFQEDLLFLKEIKSINPKIKSIVFGTYPTFYPDRCIDSEIIDFGVIGEPEFVIRDLIKLLNKHHNTNQFNTVKGICYKENSNIINTGKAPYLENLDDLPIPNRDYISNYYYFNPLVKNKRWTSALTSKGCSGTCNFCLSPEFYGNKYRFQSPKRMIDEVQYLLSKDYNEIFYRDETFTTNKQRIIKFCNLIKTLKLRFDWICNARVGTVNKQILTHMKKNGCHYLKIGVESGSQQILNNFNKGITLKETEKTFRYCHELDIKTHAHIILGGIGETKVTVSKTINFLKKIKPSTVTFNLFTPFPGTKIFEDINDKINYQIDERILDFKEILLRPHLSRYYTDLTPNYLNKIIPWAYRKYYLRIIYIMNQLKTIDSIFAIKNLIKSAFNVLIFMFSKNESQPSEI